ncbi:hypothetical protein [Streptomyces sp. NPDC046985]
MTQTTSRVLAPSDLDAALAVLDREPVAAADGAAAHVTALKEETG